MAVAPIALIVEQLYAGDSYEKTVRRAHQFLKAGVPLVWFLDTQERAIMIYSQGRTPYLLEEDKELTGEDVLPDFRCRVAEFFALPGR
ncbi:MAG TPA: Uma2 family endonuclease [Gemmataceae bacterium]|nr:Uma2 family endonuclease [Gemmataceae bacterium]